MTGPSMCWNLKAAIFVRKRSIRNYLFKIASPAPYQGIFSDRRLKWGSYPRELQECGKVPLVTGTPVSQQVWLAGRRGVLETSELQHRLCESNVIDLTL